VFRRSLTTAALLAALLLGACGGGGSSSDQGAVKQTVKDFYNAIADKDAKKVCDSISAKARKSVSDAASRTGKKQTCSQAFGLALSFGGSALQQAKNVKVGDVKIDGSKARATVSLGNRKSPVGLVKENGDWKLTGLDLSR
jgi:hypothetical protein